MLITNTQKIECFRVHLWFVCVTWRYIHCVPKSPTLSLSISSLAAYYYWFFVHLYLTR